MKVKPGYKTTEFYAVLLNAVMMVLVAAGVVTQEEATEWENLVIPVVGAVIPLVVYTLGRINLKSVQ
jgi:hypothetical protein